MNEFHSDVVKLEALNATEIWCLRSIMRRVPYHVVPYDRIVVVD